MYKIKQILKDLIPPFVLKVRIEIFNHLYIQKIGKKKFLKFWKENSNKIKDPELVQMVEYFLNSKESDAFSKYWWELIEKNINQIVVFGMENFKQTISRNYFTWVGEDAKFLIDESVYSDYKNSDVSNIVDLKSLLKKHDLFLAEESYKFNLNTAVLYFIINSRFPNQYLVEPQLGNPPSISINNKNISQDSLNSLLDFTNINEGVDISSLSSIVEIGAGYGRTAYYILEKNLNINYIIVDVPPALYASQFYLSRLFTSKKIIKFNSMTINKIEEKLISEKNLLVFLTPDQYKKLNNLKFDLTVAIDNLHAMTKIQLNEYLEKINTNSKYIYFTVWPGMKMPYDNYSHEVSDWKYVANWKQKIKNNSKIPNCYVNYLFEIQN